MTAMQWQELYVRTVKDYENNPRENGIARDARRRELDRIIAGRAAAAANEGTTVDDIYETYWASR